MAFVPRPRYDRNRTQELAKLLENILYEDFSQQTPELQDQARLIYSAVKSAIDLISAGADPNQTDSHGLTALHFAARIGDESSCLELLKKRANVNFQHRSPEYIGPTPLHYAANYEQPRIVEILVAHGAMVNVTDANLRTPLHLANKVDTIIALLRTEANALASNETKHFPPSCSMYLLHFIAKNCEFLRKLFQDKVLDLEFQKSMRKYAKTCKIVVQRDGGKIVRYLTIAEELYFLIMKESNRCIRANYGRTLKGRCALTILDKKVPYKKEIIPAEVKEYLGEAYSLLGSI